MFGVAEDKSKPTAAAEDVSQQRQVTQDEYNLAKLGYKQEFYRRLGLFENWASVFTAMNFVSGIAGLLAWVLTTGGPAPAFTHWVIVGVMAVNVAFVMAEIAASYPTAGGIYFWSYRLGGDKWGPFLSWMTAWWNFSGWLCSIPSVQQNSTNFLLSAVQVKCPDIELLYKGWFEFILTAIGTFIALAPNIISEKVLRWYLRFAVISAMTLFFCYNVWLPVKSSGSFRTGKEVFQGFNNGINEGDKKQASDAYVWTIAVLFSAWVFYGFDGCVHLAEETQSASTVVARGMWLSTLSSWAISVPTLIIMLFCIQDFSGIVNASYNNNFAEYLVQVVGENGAVGLLVLLFIDSTCVAAANIMSCQRVVFAISRDGVLPFSKLFRQLNKNKMPTNAGILVAVLSIAITTAVIGSSVAFTAITATGTIAANFSYLIPILARHTIGRKRFTPASWNLGRASALMGTVAILYIMFLFVVLLLPQVYPVNAQTLNYSPICIGIVTIISLVGWIFPFGLGARYWFHGPQRTTDAQEVTNMTVLSQAGENKV
ncbi:Amino acid or gaba permease [Pleurostoma richardsiae]|uniref:Amino acid or gaba permease n=1 Tax=Pleurostoma richardsiae TaxID=41990 RepID=A0AA38RWQ3_9PEZI|nr:Amino acid or gaba permease [Pleurostoma richardsiae]